MSEPSERPVPYQVSYSEQNRNELRALVARARDHGLAPQLIAAIKDLDYRLRMYPQFGQPLLDLVHRPGQIWIGVVPPLVVRYGLFEDLRLVAVASPIMLLLRSGF